MRAASATGVGAVPSRTQLPFGLQQGRIAWIELAYLVENRARDRTHGRSPVDLMMQARCSGSVPVVTGVLGASAGHGALIAGISDFCVMTQGAEQQLRVTARYSDGSEVDVTRLARYQSNAGDLATADERGVVKTLDGVGEAAVMVRFGGQVTVARAMASPSPECLPKSSCSGLTE